MDNIHKLHEGDCTHGDDFQWEQYKIKATD